MLNLQNLAPTPDKRGSLLEHAGQQIERPPALRLPLVARTIRSPDLATGAVIGVARQTCCHLPPATCHLSPGPERR
ncbi:hypothetical protein [Streptomyces sp. N2A]|uniref:hypothetical protein n=1 Tax=Streptomyces sp. N2A TaxID=3073936 RepID=UPI0028704D01|nr:hypothetical protein [Streptomyces sp. N2A]